MNMMLMIVISIRFMKFTYIMQYSSVLKIIPTVLSFLHKSLIDNSVHIVHHVKISSTEIVIISP